MDEIIEKLVEFAELDKDNMGLITYELMSLYEQRCYLPKWFISPLEMMLTEQLSFYISNYEIVEREVTRTHTVRELEEI